MMRRIDHTTITVRDLQRSVEFYTRMLGFEIDHEMVIPESRLRIAYLRLGDTMLELFGVEIVAGEALSDANDVVGYKHIALLVESVDVEYRRLSAVGVPFRIAPTTVQRERLAFLKDPDGLDIELIEHLEKEHS